MDKSQKVRDNVVTLLSQHFGEKLGKSFQAANAEDTLPIFMESARVILGEFIGKEKAEGELNQILASQNMGRVNE